MLSKSAVDVVPIQGPVNVSNLIATIGGLSAITGGLGMSLYALNDLAKGVMLQRMDPHYKPTPAIQKEIRLRSNDVTNSLAGYKTRDSEEEDKKGSKEKRASDVLSEWVGGGGSFKTSNPKFNDSVNKQLGSGDASKTYLFPDTVKTDSPYVKDVLLPLAEHPVMAASLLLPAGAAAICLAPRVSRKVVKWISSDLLGSKKLKSDSYIDKARRVYDDAVNESITTAKEGSAKQASWWNPLSWGGDPQAKEYSTVTSNPISLNNGVGIGLGILGAAGVLGLMRGLTAGKQQAVNKRAVRVSLLKAWKAQQKEREYNYVPITARFAKEPIDVGGITESELRNALKEFENIKDDGYTINETLKQS